MENSLCLFAIPRPSRCVGGSLTAFPAARVRVKNFGKVKIRWQGRPAPLTVISSISLVLEEAQRLVIDRSVLLRLPSRQTGPSAHGSEQGPPYIRRKRFLTTNLAAQNLLNTTKSKGTGADAFCCRCSRTMAGLTSPRQWPGLVPKAFQVGC